MHHKKIYLVPVLFKILSVNLKFKTFQTINSLKIPFLLLIHFFSWSLSKQNILKSTKHILTTRSFYHVYSIGSWQPQFGKNFEIIHTYFLNISKAKFLRP